MHRQIKSLLLGSTFALLAAHAATAGTFNIPGGDLDAALSSYMAQTGVSLVVSNSAVRGIRTEGVKGNLSSDDALARLLKGTGFVPSRGDTGVIAIIRRKDADDGQQVQFAQATIPAAPSRAVETVTVTSSKLGGADVQSIPISITALSQEQLTATQTAGGPDLIKQVPNMTFTKTNFSGYSIQIRGIGTQAISVTTDPAVAVALNDQPFIRNHFFEQEFYDVAQVEVLRGPQGTLYGRNATAGVVNLTSAKPSDQFEAMASGEIGNYHQRRFEGMLNLPLVDDRVSIRFAGEWTKRQGYSFNETTGERIDGRDLWSGRVTLGFKPSENFNAYLMWEHFSEDDDRIRSSKQLCKTASPPGQINGVNVPAGSSGLGGALTLGQDYLSQGCEATSLYSSDAFQVPYGFSLPYVIAANLGGGFINDSVDPYASTTQSRNLRVMQSTIDPSYKSKNDIVELNMDYSVKPSLTVTSQTAFNHDFLWSTQDYNRFNTAPGLFNPGAGRYDGDVLTPNGVFCDPQLGCADRLVAEDLSTEHSWQLSQEFRLASNFSGPFNFSAGGNYLHYETEENYYVFINTLSLYSLTSAAPHDPYVPGVTDNSECLLVGGYPGSIGHQQQNPENGGGQPTSVCVYMDPNPIGSLNNKGHNYFLSQNPYLLDSYAAFGEVYYNILDDLKLIGGLRWTEDRKHFVDIPSELVTVGYGYGTTGTVDQQWDQFTGRAAVNWMPKLNFADQTLLYASYAHGYKAGGANPPGAVLDTALGGGEIGFPIHPLTFKPEFVDAFEIGSKNTFLDGALTFNASAFYYNYEHYQISEIVDRTSINLNFDAHIKGAEVEGVWEPIPGLRFNFSGGWEDTAIAQGERAIDLMDRTAGHSDWLVVRPFPTQASNCILPAYVVSAAIVQQRDTTGISDESGTNPGLICQHAYSLHVDPVISLTPTYILPPGYPGFDPTTAPNNGEGFDKDLGGNELPNAPPFTVSLGGQYTVPITSDWAGTLRGDFYWQANSWARVFNDDPYDRIHGYKNFNLSVILTSQEGWQVMLYDKNVFNTTAITGTFLNSDDSGLTTNIFLTDPKLIGVRVTKNW